MTTNMRRVSATTLAVLLAFALVALGVARTTSAGFSATTDGSGGWGSGSVAISDDDAGTALFSTGSDGLLDGGQTLIKCISTTYTGTITQNVQVRLYGTASGALAPYLNTTIEQGTGGGAGSCTGFTPSTTVHSGTLASFASTRTDFATGVGNWSPTAGGQSQSWRITLTVQNTAAAQSATATGRFVWEAKTVKPPTYDDQVATDAPFAYWKMDEIGTGPYLDASGNGRDATMVNTPYQRGASAGGIGLGGTSTFYNGTQDTGQYGEIAPANTSFITGRNTMSLEGWFRSNGATYAAMASMYDSSQACTNAKNMWFARLDGSGYLQFGGCTTAGGWSVYSTAPKNDNQWHHFVGVIDSGTVARLYVDGALANTTAITGTMNTGVGQPLRLAAGSNNGALYTGFNGYLDNLAVYPGALSQARVTAHYQAGINPKP